MSDPHSQDFTNALGKYGIPWMTTWQVGILREEHFNFMSESLKHQHGFIFKKVDIDSVKMSIPDYHKKLGGHKYINIFGYVYLLEQEFYTLFTENFLKYHAKCAGMYGNYKEPTEWCDQNCTSWWSHINITFMFSNPNDALFFKLTF